MNSGNRLKGIAIAMTLVIVIGIAIIVMALLAIFFVQSAGRSMNLAEAQQMFHEQCPMVRQCQNFQSAYPKLVEACQVIYGQDRGLCECLVRCDCGLVDDTITALVTSQCGYEPSEIPGLVMYKHSTTTIS